VAEVSLDARATWTQVKGLTKFGFARKASSTDTTDFTDDGQEKSEIMSRGADCKLEGFFLEDSTGARDPGQANVETYADAVGAASVGDFRLTSPNGKKYTFSASVEINDIGGGNNDKTSWGATLHRVGALAIT